MAIRLLRESSETPNVTNKDDVRMTRYAYGGYDGVVYKYGDMLSAYNAAGSFRINSGMVVLNGWEVEIDGAGWSIDVSNMTGGPYFYTIYLEVNAELETAEIKYLYDTVQYPEIDPGDDLTEILSGTARLVLYHAYVYGGNVVSMAKKTIDIPHGKMDYEYLNNALEKVKNRLDDLGFKEGVATIDQGSNTSMSIESNSLKKQGKYVLFNLSVYVRKEPYVESWSFTIPEGFRPKEEISVISAKGDNLSYPNLLTIKTDGTCIVPYQFSVIGMTTHIYNVGWETA